MTIRLKRPATTPNPEEVGDPNGQRVEARLVKPVAREHDREVHAGHDDRGPHRGAEAEPQRGAEDDEPVQEIEVGRVAPRRRPRS